MPSVELSGAQLHALGQKLDALDLTDDERTLLNAVFAAAAPEPEVAGYAYEFYNAPFSLSLVMLYAKSGPDPGQGGPMGWDVKANRKL